MKKMVILFLLVILFGQSPDKMPNDIRWVRNSKEHDALYEQVYANAWRQIAKQAQETSDPWVIVMDLDETVLDNSLYQVKLFEKGEHFTPESWDVWVTRSAAGLVPGVKAFIDSIHTRTKGQIIYISNRMANRTEETKLNLKQDRIYEEEDIFILRKDHDDTKSVRRHEVITGSGRMAKVGARRVLAYFGDAMGDFPATGDTLHWGVNKFILPNPLYGKW